MCSWKSAWISHFHLFVLSKSFSEVGNRLANENGINRLALRLKAIMKAFSGFAHCSQYNNLPTQIKNHHKRVGIPKRENLLISKRYESGEVLVKLPPYLRFKTQIVKLTRPHSTILHKNSVYVFPNKSCLLRKCAGSCATKHCRKTQKKLWEKISLEKKTSKKIPANLHRKLKRLFSFRFGRFDISSQKTKFWASVVNKLNCWYIFFASITSTRAKVFLCSSVVVFLCASKKNVSEIYCSDFFRISITQERNWKSFLLFLKK